MNRLSHRIVWILLSALNASFPAWAQQILEPGQKYKLTVQLDDVSDLDSVEIYLGSSRVDYARFDEQGRINDPDSRFKLRRKKNRFETVFQVPQRFRGDGKDEKPQLIVYVLDRALNHYFAMNPIVEKMDGESSDPKEMKTRTDAYPFVAEVQNARYDNEPPKWISGSAVAVNDTMLRVDAVIEDDSPVASYLFFDTINSSSGRSCRADAKNPKRQYCTMMVNLPRAIPKNGVPSGSVLFMDEAENRMEVPINTAPRKEGDPALQCPWPYQVVPALLARNYHQSTFEVTGFKIAPNAKDPLKLDFRFVASGPVVRPFLQPTLHQDDVGMIIERELQCANRIGDAAFECTGSIQLPVAIRAPAKGLQILISSDVAEDGLFSQELTVDELPSLKQVPLDDRAPKITSVKLKHLN